MTIHNFHDGAFFASTNAEALSQFGLHLETGTNFETYRSLLGEARPGHELGAPLDPKYHNMDDTNSFWLVARDEENKVVHTQAMRILDLSHATLATYLRNRFREFPPSIPGLNLAASRYRASPGAQRIAGKVCYHGEFWIGGEDGQYRGQGLAGLLGRAAFHEAMWRWDPDYVFGFMAKSVAFKGFSERHGYMHAEPGAVRWAIADQAPIEGFLVHMGREDMQYVLDMPVDDFDSIAA